MLTGTNIDVEVLLSTFSQKHPLQIRGPTVKQRRILSSEDEPIAGPSGLHQQLKTEGTY